MKDNKDSYSASDVPMVSVVMVAYNSAPYIAEAIAGVVGQRCAFGVQLVINDDASTDSTGSIVAEWAAQFPGIIDYRRNDENLGVQGNYLAALARCRGKYIAMCDADDYWCDPSKLQRQVEYMETHPECALTYHRVINLYEPSGEMSLSNGGGAVETTAEGLASRNPITNLSVLYRASMMQLDRLPAWLADVRLIDYGLHMLTASRGTLHYSPRPMGVYRHLPSAIWSEAEQGRRLEMALAVRRHLISQLSDRPELTSRLRKACDDMIAAANSPAATRRSRRPLLTRLRAAVSRLLPRPRPAGSRFLSK
ncbi:MAG: glycosyltransferase [Muribaculaceae bacterium]|nr:glycosyltransferase [Muribaculaceae bacterium]